MPRKATGASNNPVSSLSPLTSSTSGSTKGGAQPVTYAAAQTAALAAVEAADQAAAPALAITPFLRSLPLLATNTLVGLSQVAGNLDYPAYVEHLTRNGHLRNPPNTQGVSIPAQPMNSSVLQRDRGDRTDGLTDYRPDQALWSQDNLPDMLYVFDKPSNWRGKSDLKEPPIKTYPIYGKLLREIPILPDHISQDVEGWRLEVWHRFDPRINKHDLVDRMPPAARGGYNADLSMRAQRFRRDANLLGWVAKGGNFGADKQRLTALLQAAGVPLALNTTRGITWGANLNGQPIPVPAKLRWASCVEAAPATAPAPAVVAPAVAAVAHTIPLPSFAATASAPVNVPAPASASPALFPTSTNTQPPIQGRDLPVTQAPSVAGTLVLVSPNVPSLSSSSRSRPARPTMSARSNSPSTISLPPSPTSDTPLDPQVFQDCPPGQLPATSRMNPPPLPSQTRTSITSGSSLPMSTATVPPRQLLNGSISIIRRTPLNQGERRLATSFSPAPAPPSTKNIPTSSNPPLKRKNSHDDDQDSGLEYIGKNNERRKTKLRDNNNKPFRRYRSRWPRTAFGDAGEDRPESFHEWIQEGGASDVVIEAGSVNTEQIQPAQPSLGYHELYFYHHEGNVHVLAAPEDFLHPTGVDVGRSARGGGFEQEFSGVNAGRRLWVPEAERLPLDYYQIDEAARPEAMAAPAPRPVECTPQSSGWCTRHLEEGESNALSQDLARLDYPSLK